MGIKILSILFIIALLAMKVEAAIAIAASKGGTEVHTDIQYFITYNSTSHGFACEKEARQDWNKAYESNKSV